MAAPITHGGRRLSIELGVRRQVGRRPRLSDHTRRALARLQRRLDAAPIEATRDGLVDSISRATILQDHCDAAMLAAAEAGDLANQQSLGRLAYWFSNRLDRERELLLLLEER